MKEMATTKAMKKGKRSDHNYHRVNTRNYHLTKSANNLSCCLSMTVCHTAQHYDSEHRYGWFGRDHRLDSGQLPVKEHSRLMSHQYFRSSHCCNHRWDSSNTYHSCNNCDKNQNHNRSGTSRKKECRCSRSIADHKSSLKALNYANVIFAGLKY